MTGLQGRSVVVTRAPHQAAELETLLTERGATPLLYPCIDIVPPEDATLLDAALLDAARGQFSWLVLTSANTVIALEKRLTALNLPHGTLAALKVAAIGPATAREAKIRLDWQTSVIPEDHVSEALAESLTSAISHSGRESEKTSKGSLRVLLPQSEIAESGLAEQLQEHGADVRAVVAYRTVIGSGGVDLPALLDARRVDAITFTSGSTVTNCLKRLDSESSGHNALTGAVVACIGPKTAHVARNAGLTVDVMPAEHTLEALVAALDTHFLTEATGV